MKRCLYCGKSFAYDRSTGKYCSTRHKNRYNYEKSKHEQSLQPVRDEIAKVEERIEYYQNYSLSDVLGDDQKEIWDKKLKELQNNLRLVNSWNDKRVVNQVRELKLKGLQPLSDKWINISFKYQDLSEEREAQIAANFRQWIQKKLDEHKAKEPPFVEYLTDEGVQEKITELENKKRGLQAKLVPYKPTIEHHPAPKKGKLSINENLEVEEDLDDEPLEYGAGEIRNMNIKTLNLKGTLGQFLGKLDQNMTFISLTGASASGKSTFSYQLAKLFLDHGLTAKYFSKEEGAKSIPVQEKLDRFGLTNRLRMSGIDSKYRHVMKQAKHYDVIFMDSFSKFTTTKGDLDRLRNVHPKTIFVAIFQQTTAKTMVGGTGPKFDSSAKMVVTKDEATKLHYVTMEKSRYGTQGWVYCIEHDEIVQRG